MNIVKNGLGVGDWELEGWACGKKMGSKQHGQGWGLGRQPEGRCGWGFLGGGVELGLVNQGRVDKQGGEVRTLGWVIEVHNLDW